MVIVRQYISESFLLLMLMMTACWLCKLTPTLPKRVVNVTELVWWPVPITHRLGLGG